MTVSQELTYDITTFAVVPVVSKSKERKACFAFHWLTMVEQVYV